MAARWCAHKGVGEGVSSAVLRPAPRGFLTVVVPRFEVMKARVVVHKGGVPRIVDVCWGAGWGESVLGVDELTVGRLRGSPPQSRVSKGVSPRGSRPLVALPGAESRGRMWASKTCRFVGKKLALGSWGAWGI